MKSALLRCNFRLRCKMCAGLIAVDLFAVLWYDLIKGSHGIMLNVKWTTVRQLMFNEV